MKSYICGKCGYSEKANNLKDSFICPNCGASREFFSLYEENSDDDTLDAIIDSVLDESNEIKNEKIINKNSEDKFLYFDENNKILKRNDNKCINCGKCKKTCEGIENISYDLNTNDKPICIKCGQCGLNCPEHAIEITDDSKKVKDLIEQNKKIVVAIISPLTVITLNHILKKDVSNKIVDILKQIGFDYVFSSAYGYDLYTFEFVAELIKNRKEKRKPLFTSVCPAFINYIKIYHSELLDKISTCLNPVEMQAKVIKKYFSEKKGFDKESIKVVSIGNCVALDYLIDEEGIDYNIYSKELANMIIEEKINIDNTLDRKYDDLVGEGSKESQKSEISCELSKAIINSFYKIIMKKEVDVSKIQFFSDQEGKIKITNIIMDNINIKVAVVNRMDNLEYLLSHKYDDFDIIEVLNCSYGCLGGGGQEYALNEGNEEYYNEILNILRNKKSKFKNTYDNVEIKKLYNEYLKIPLSEESKNLLHQKN